MPFAANDRFEPTLIDAAKCLNGRNAHKTEFAKFGVSA